MKLGIIGLSEGNGHPYSWSAIFNGYHVDAMAECGFPAIPAYLAEQSWPEARIPDCAVTHIWTQDTDLSAKVAKAALISTVVDQPEAMVGQVDALLLARDDGQNHAQFAVPFLDAGLPVYIDKPAALSRAALANLYDHQQYPGQIFSCSALGYAQELLLDDPAREELGAIRQIIATTPKYWDTYAMHLIEPMFQQARRTSAPCSVTSVQMADATSVLAEWDDGFRAALHATGKNAAPLAFDVIGEKASMRLIFKDSFSAFRAALVDFVAGIRSRDVRSERTTLEAMVYLLEKGRG